MNLDDAGLRERKKRARRGAIIDAAQRLVQEHGLDAVTVEMISAEVGISARTFFNYFDTKDDAVLGLEHLAVDPEVAAAFVAGGPTGRLVADLQTLIASVLHAVTPDLARARSAHELARLEPRLLQRQFAWVERHKSDLGAIFAARRTADPDSLPVDDETLFMVLLLMVRSTAIEWERSGYDGEAGDHLPAAVERIKALLAS